MKMLTEEEIKDLGFKELERINKMIDVLTKQKEHIEKKDKEELIITDHAAIRYMERVKGIDVKEEIRKQIQESQTKKFYDVMGNGAYAVAGTFKAIISDNCIKTII